MCLLNNVAVFYHCSFIYTIAYMLNIGKANCGWQYKLNV
jgi:hypothetical protein